MAGARARGGGEGGRDTDGSERDRVNRGGRMISECKGEGKDFRVKRKKKRESANGVAGVVLR